MLVLSRKRNESVVINDQITVTVLEVHGKTVKLGIQAPGNVPVLRGELVVQLPPEVSGETSDVAA